LSQLHIAIMIFYETSFSRFLSPIALDLSAESALYRQLYSWFRGAIVGGKLRPPAFALCEEPVQETANLAYHRDDLTLSVSL
jgi:hypothetical protein